MNGCEWIVCESTTRWAAALRLALERRLAVEGRTVRLYETRHWNDLASRLRERPDSFVAAEVREENLAEVFSGLLVAVRHYPRARFVALLDRSLLGGRKDGTSTSGERLHDVCDALREAGVLEFAHSPRHLGNIVVLFRRHEALSTRMDFRLSADLPVRAQVWASLPWQAQRSRVG